MIDLRARTRSWWKRNRTIALTLAATATLIVLARLHTFDEPLEPDLLTYATIGHEMVKGERLYSDIWDVKPPGLYATYALGELIAGHGAREVFFLGTLAALVTLASVCCAGATLSPIGGLCAAAFWTALSGTLVIQANQPNSEVFIGVWCVLGFVLVLRRTASGLAWGRLGLAGLCFGIGSTYKPIVVMAAVCVAAAHVLTPPPGVSRKTALAEALIMGVGGATVWGLIFGYAAITDQLSIYWATNITMNGARSAGLLFNLFRYVREGRILPRAMLFLLPIVVLVTSAAALSLRRGLRREWVLFLALAMGVHLMILIQGSAFHPHSYQLWLPVISVGAGLAVAAAPEWTAGLPGGARRWIVPALAAASLAIVVTHELPNYFLAPEEWARRKYGPGVMQDRKLSYAVGNLLRPSETVFEYGNGAAVYYYNDLRPTTMTLWAAHLLTGNVLSTRLGEETLVQLRKEPPDLFIVQAPIEWTGFDAPMNAESGLAYRWLNHAAAGSQSIAWDQHPIYQWAMANYRLVRGITSAWSSRMAVYVRKGSAADLRLGDS